MAKFNVGDKVYYPKQGLGKIFTLELCRSSVFTVKIKEYDSFTDDGYEYDSDKASSIFHVNHKNYEALSVLYPDIEFELPIMQLI